MIRCGLLGEKLGHSRSPEIHARLADYEYRLYEREEDRVEDFIRNGDWTGMNVTIPYKKTVLPYLDELSPVARAVGSVNTVLRQPDGSLFGDNTDVAGFEAMVRYSGFRLTGEKVLVLGSGGASVSVTEALRRLGADSVIISRKGPDNYENLERHRDATYLVNTTPVGMYPHGDASPVDPKRLPELRGVLDLIYNPTETLLMKRAAAMGIPSVNGLYMLVAQARRSAEIFTGKPIPDERVEEIFRELAAK